MNTHIPDFDAEWNRFYTPEQVAQKLKEGWSPIFLSFQSIDGKMPEPSHPILYGWKRYVEKTPPQG